MVTDSSLTTIISGKTELILVNQEALVAASNVFSAASTNTFETTALYCERGVALRDSWLGAGSSAFSSSYQAIRMLLEKTNEYLEKESDAILTAGERFKSEDEALAMSY